jgi:hypothetical protein
MEHGTEVKQRSAREENSETVDSSEEEDEASAFKGILAQGPTSDCVQCICRIGNRLRLIS